MFVLLLIILCSPVKTIPYQFHARLRTHVFPFDQIESIIMRGLDSAVHLRFANTCTYKWLWHGLAFDRRTYADLFRIESFAKV